MAYEAWYDDDLQVIRVRVIGVYAEEDVQEFSQQCDRWLAETPHRQLLIDLDQAGKMSGTATRRQQAAYLERAGITHMAMYNVRPAIRIMAKILARLTGGATKSGFFASEAEAVEWLKKERE